ncbi:MAG: NFACT family protein, partial [Candidatus Aenigmarchaeota archaeon]|nr:NFACT family protein [Candidatus Aenigmarchaeota archaeon]
MKSRKSSRNPLKITSLEIMRLASDLQKFVGCRLDNVFHDGRRLFLKVSSKNGIEIRPDVIFASEGFSSPATGFSQILRKHLKGRKISSLSQHRFDRIMVMGFSSGTVVIEMFHRGNVVLCGPEMRIIAALSQREWKDRSLMPGSVYKFPESGSVATPEELDRCMDSDDKIVSVLVKNGMGFHAESILESCGIEKTKPCKSLSAGDRKNLFGGILSAMKETESEMFGRALEASIRDVSGERASSILDKQKSAVKKMEERQREAKAKAEKIYEKFSEISGLFREMKGSEIEVDGMKIKLERSLSLQKNAEKYFEEGKKMGKKIGRAAVEMAREKPVKEEVRREWYHKYRWFFTSDEFLVIAGKDAKTNSEIVKKRLDDSDIVIHAEIHGAAFAVVKCGKKSAAKNALDEAMQFAACYSKAWAMSLGNIDVYWVRPGQLKNMVGTGTFGIEGEKNYVRRMELMLGAGYVKDALEIMPFRSFRNL